MLGLFCYRCGHKLRDDANYCSFCGTPVDKTGETSTQKDYQLQSNPSKHDTVDVIIDAKNESENKKQIL
ncbi:zinc ribbon domain-containing protein [Selenomonas caprae]|uniref:Zinc ribbon domain-containing protein n=1 Tax=Selenomonas caprae TaxID=2606905 RepID=A0A5D6WHW6_9FIRM|nr:zinc ribbon domain-containing protein [Selenomonas caprae]